MPTRRVLLRVEREQSPALLDARAVLDLEGYRPRLFAEDAAMLPQAFLVIVIAGTGKTGGRGDRRAGLPDLLWPRDLDLDDDLIVVAGHGRRARDDAAALELNVERRRTQLAGHEGEWHTPLGATVVDAQFGALGTIRQLRKGDDVDGANGGMAD